MAQEDLSLQGHLLHHPFQEDQEDLVVLLGLSLEILGLLEYLLALLGLFLCSCLPGLLRSLLMLVS